MLHYNVAMFQGMRTHVYEMNMQFVGAKHLGCYIRCHKICNFESYHPMSQIIDHFGFSRYLVLLYTKIYDMSTYKKNCVSIKVKMSYGSERREYNIVKTVLSFEH
jgi:hypothetical protein